MSKFIIVVLAILLSFSAASGEDTRPGDILDSYVTDFREDAASGEREVTFGVKIKKEGTWTVKIEGEKEISLRKGVPGRPTFLYVTDMETLRRMDRGELAVLTAMGKASGSDFAPMDFELMEGSQPPDDFMEFLAPFTFHFWTRGFPEKIKFGSEKYTRVVHGANVTAFYYQKGFRSAWYQILKGQHINEKPEDQTNPFPTLAIFTGGEAEARIGGEYLKIEEGTGVFIPAAVSHEFWNNREQPAEFIILMFGEGA